MGSAGGGRDSQRSGRVGGSTESGATELEGQGPKSSKLMKK